MSYKIKTIPSFDKDFKRLYKRYRSLPDDIKQLVEYLQINPLMGVDLGDQESIPDKVVKELLNEVGIGIKDLRSCSRRVVRGCVSALCVVDDPSGEDQEVGAPTFLCHCLHPRHH